MKVGRKGKFEELAPKILKLIREGCSFKETCQIVGLNEGTFYRWKSENEEFCEAIKNAMDERQDEVVGTLEKSLIKKANGYTVTECRTEYAMCKGKLNKIKESKTIKEIAPDTGALVFALTNLAPEKWQNKQRQEISGEGGEPFKIVVSDNDDADLIKQMTEK